VTRDSARLLLDTLRLGGGERGTPERAAARHAWSRVDARAMAALAVWEGGAQWLLRRLRELGLEDAAPSPLRAALRRVAMDEQARGMLVDAETQELERYLIARGVPSVLIKGPARRAASGRYPYAEARVTLDVDVLLPAQHVQEVWNDLRERGWPLATDPAATPEGHYHPPPLRGPNGVPVELHSSTGYAVTPGEAWRRANDGGAELEWNQVRVRVPSATELLWHGLTRALVAGPDGFRLRHFLDAAAILASGAAVDWNRIVTRLAAGEEADPPVARAWLRSAAELAAYDLPASALGACAPFDLVRALSWRLAVLARGRDAGFAARLLEEGTRTELGMGVAPVVEGTGPFLKTRRWVAGRAARIAYGAWRVVDRTVADGRREWNRS
jgi:hypothetical protein